MGVLETISCAESNEDRHTLDNTLNKSLLGCTDIHGDSFFAAGGAIAGDVGRYSMFAAMMIIAALTVFLNAAIIACVFRFPRLGSSNYSVYVISLALSDMLLCGICLPFMALYTFLGYWPLGDVVCIFFIISDLACCSISNLTLDVIAYDRFRAVEDPLSYRSQFTKSRARKLAASVWLICMLYFIPGIAISRIRGEIQGTNIPEQCHYSGHDAFFVVGIVVFSSYASPVILIALSVILLIKLKRRKASRLKTINTSQGQESFGGTTDKTTTNTTEGKQISEQNRRCLVTLLAQIILFLISWGPWMVIFPIASICDHCVPVSAFDASYFLAVINSTINPVLYLVFNKDYKRAFFTMLFCPKKRQQ